MVMTQSFAPGDDLIFQLESGFGLLRVIAIDEREGKPVWHLLAYEELFPDIESAEGGSGTVVIRRSQTDVAGEGATAYLSPLSMRLVGEWLKSSRQKSGRLFARVLGKETAGDGFTAQNVTAVLRKVGRWIGLDRKEWERISGHSARVGAAQDLLGLNMDLPSVMQAGRWKDTRMPMRYGERVLAGRSAMARAAKAQGRV